eukprot:Em0008g145a
MPANADVNGVNPPHFCKRVMDKTASAYENKMPFRNTLEEFLNFTLMSSERRERMSYGSAPGGAQAQGGKVGVLRNQVDEVKGVMRQNIEKVAQRGEKLEDLGERAENLSHDANNFQRSAVRLKRKLWWQNVKLWIILIIVILVILGVIAAIIAIAVTQTKN